MTMGLTLSFEMTAFDSSKVDAELILHSIFLFWAAVANSDTEPKSQVKKINF